MAQSYETTITVRSKIDCKIRNEQEPHVRENAFYKRLACVRKSCIFGTQTKNKTARLEITYFCNLLFKSHMDI